MKNNRICQILGIEKPVIQGPLSWLTDARLVAAVSNAGGLGVLGPNAGLIEGQIRMLAERQSVPLGLEPGQAPLSQHR